MRFDIGIRIIVAEDNPRVYNANINQPPKDFPPPF